MNEVLRDALEAAKSGNQDEARVMLAEYLRREPDNVPAWVLLSKLAKSPVQKAAFLRKVLDIDPDHAYARQALEELGQAPAPVVNAAAEPPAEEAPEEEVSEQPAAQEPAPEPVLPEEHAEVDETAQALEVEETVEPLEDEWPVSEGEMDYDEQAAGETLPPWMSADETMIESEPAERAAEPAVSEPAQGEEEEYPEWLRDEEADVTPHVAQATTDAEEAAASEKAARLSQAMAQQSPAVVEPEAESDRGWLLPLLIAVAVVVFLLLVYAIFTLI
ncbi:MAG: hypothetical protein ACOC9Z_04020 [Chloroflexota bacterium]